MTEHVTFHKIVSEGKALAHWHDKALFVVGPLPEETAEVRVTRDKSRWAEGVVEAYTTASLHRHEPREEHYMSCSPWQSVDYAYQLELKRTMLTELYGRPGLELAVADMIGSPQPLGYRNKLDFALLADADGQLELAFHERGSYQAFATAPTGCVLGDDTLNAAAQAVLVRMNALGLADVAESLTVRRSQAHGEVVAIVHVKSAAKRDWQRLRVAEVAGLAVVRAIRHDIYETLWTAGKTDLTETIAGLELMYSWEAFFQVNVPVFEHALAQIMSTLKPGTKVIDLYGGVGAIGLPAAQIAGEVVAVEVAEVAVKRANTNAARAGLSNYRAIQSSSEQIDPELLSDADTIVVDPPRAGLTPQAIALLAEAAPRQIVYLSCNPVTQVRDIMLLAEWYKAAAPTGFDFYPGTLHLESLVVLTRLSS